MNRSFFFSLSRNFFYFFAPFSFLVFFLYRIAEWLKFRCCLAHFHHLFSATTFSIFLFSGCSLFYLVFLCFFLPFFFFHSIFRLRFAAFHFDSLFVVLPLVYVCVLFFFFFLCIAPVNNLKSPIYNNQWKRKKNTYNH